MKYRKIETAGKTMMVCIFTLGFFSFWATPIRADEEAVAGREIMKRFKNAVVTVEMTIEQRMVVSGREMHRSESKTEAIATVIEPSGLSVLSLFTTDPTRIFDLFDMDEFGEEDMQKLNWESQITDVKMVLSDGNEVPAKIVLRDEDLDLAFVRPVEKLTKPIPALDLSKAAIPQILDQVVVLTRLGKIASRVHSVSLSRIEAVVRKPRILYVPGSAGVEGGLGAPVFSLDGKLVGVVVLRIMKSKRIGMGGMFGGMGGSGIIPVVMPAEEIAEVAKQAPEVTGEPES